MSSRCRPVAVMLAASFLWCFALSAQVTSFPDSPIHVVMTGPTGLNSGECGGRLDPPAGSLILTCTHDVPGGRVVLTRGEPEENVQIVDLGTAPIVDVQLGLTETQVAAILTGDVWVAVESAARPLGEIFARLLVKTPTGESVMRFPLTNHEMVQTNSTATGTCAIRIPAGNAPIPLLCVHTVANPTTLGLFIDGGQVRSVSGVDSPFEIVMPEFRTNFARFLDNDYGILLRSNAFPSGEIGDVIDDCIESPTSLCLNRERFRVTVQFTAPGKAPEAGRAVPPRSDDSGMFWFFSPANWEVLVKVLSPCGGGSQHFWVFLSANTNVAFTATVFDTLTGRTKVYSNPQGQIAATVADTAAFPCT